MSTPVKKFREEIPAFVAKVEERRAQPPRSKKKKWKNLTDAEKDNLLKQLVLEAGLLDET